MNSPQLTPAELTWLLGDPGARLLEQLRGDSRADLAIAEVLRRDHSVALVHWLLTTLELRDRARSKFPAPERMFFTRMGLQQATDHWLAAYKAARFPPDVAIADLCCGVGGDLAALAARGPAVGVDREPLLAAFAQHNAGVGLARTACQSVESVDLAEYAGWHIDPDRRPGGQRATSPDRLEPAAEVIDGFRNHPGVAAIKLAPASITPPHWAAEGECEWLSRGGECRQQVVWLGNHCPSPGTRRATIVAADAGDRHRLVVERTLGASSPNVPPVDERIDDFVYEPDAAVLAAGLVGTLAGEHGLWAWSGLWGYLSGRGAVHDAALRGYVVRDRLPYRAKPVSAYFRERGIGRVDIKHRGIQGGIEAFRAGLKLHGAGHATLMVAPWQKSITVLVVESLPAAIASSAGSS